MHPVRFVSKQSPQQQPLPVKLCLDQWDGTSFYSIKFYCCGTWRRFGCCLLRTFSIHPELTAAGVSCSCSGAAQSDAEAERICEALRAAGIVLKVGDLVYLRPQEVTAMVMRVSGQPSLDLPLFTLAVHPISQP